MSKLSNTKFPKKLWFCKILIMYVIKCYWDSIAYECRDSSGRPKFESHWQTALATFRQGNTCFPRQVYYLFLSFGCIVLCWNLAISATNPAMNVIVITSILTRFAWPGDCEKISWSSWQVSTCPSVHYTL